MQKMKSKDRTEEVVWRCSLAMGKTISKVSNLKLANGEKSSWVAVASDDTPTNLDEVLRTLVYIQADLLYLLSALDKKEDEDD